MLNGEYHDVLYEVSISNLHIQQCGKHTQNVKDFFHQKYFSRLHDCVDTWGLVHSCSSRSHTAETLEFQVKLMSQ